MRQTILYIHHGKGIGGAGLSLLYLIKTLDREKFHPVVLFLYDSSIIELFKKSGIEVVGPINICDFPHTKIWSFAWYHIVPFFKACRDTLKTWHTIAALWLDWIKPDLVHLNTSSLIAWAMVAHAKKIPVVWHVREPLARGYFGFRRKFIERCVAKYADVIIPISSTDGSPWLELAKTKIKHNPVDDNIFDATCQSRSQVRKYYKIEKNDPTILFLGGLSEQKGTLEILMIFQKLLQKMPDVKLLLAGYFSAESSRYFLWDLLSPFARYKKRVRTILDSIQDSVRILGAIDNVAQVMAASDVIVFPATVGHFARPVIEAGFMKKPVVVSAFSPLNELVINGETGLFIDINDHDLWAESLQGLLSDSGYAHRMGQQAYQFCKEKFSLQPYGQFIQTVYDDLLKNKIFYNQQGAQDECSIF